MIALTSLFSAAGLVVSAHAQQGPEVLPPIVIEPSADGVTQSPSPRVSRFANEGLSLPSTSTTLGSAAIESDRTATSDTAALLTRAPGVTIYQAGGVSGMPAINGLNDDRVRILLNGMAVKSACANSMNPPLSYSDPSQVSSIEIISGVTPVSKGGDSIAGTVIVETAEPTFAATADGVHRSGEVSTIYRSNGNGVVVSGKAEVSTRNVSIGYAGAWTRAGNYKDGNGDAVRSTEYEAQNHAVSLAFRGDSYLLTMQGGVQYIPYQGYVNQRMDMVDNKAGFFNTKYVGQFGWGTLEARAFYHKVSHEMNFLDDKKHTTPMGRDMPMRTEGQTFGYSLKAEVALTPADKLRFGNEFHGQRLDDWWPPVPGMMMMCCSDYLTINNGKRDRLGTFAEWERKWSGKVTTLFGVRNDIVWMDTGDVQGYNVASYGADAAAFNARDHKRTDVNWDATAMLQYQPSDRVLFEAAYGMKTRSPNLYERYTWTTKDSPMDMGGQMAMSMIGWFGDGNGYVGNLDLKPEVAHTVSLTTGWSDGPAKKWALKVTPYYTYVSDFIGVRRWPVANSQAALGFTNLQFANHDAEIYGINVTGSMPLTSSETYGNFGLSGILGYVHGENADTGVSLYHMMPLYSRIALTHQLGGWSTQLQLDLYAGKHNVDTVRNELETGGYALVNLRTSYEWQNLRFSLGVDNLLDRYYEPALGGTYLYPVMAGTVATKGNVPGAGRSVNAGLTVKF